MIKTTMENLKQCLRHKEDFKYNLFGYFCIKCYNENLLSMRAKGLIP